MEWRVGRGGFCVGTWLWPLRKPPEYSTLCPAWAPLLLSQLHLLSFRKASQISGLCQHSLRSQAVRLDYLPLPPCGSWVWAQLPEQGLLLLPPWVMVWIPLMESFQRGHQTGFHGVLGNEVPGLWGSRLWLRDARQAGFLELLCTETEGSGHRRRAQPSIPRPGRGEAC